MGGAWAVYLLQYDTAYWTGHGLFHGMINVPRIVPCALPWVNPWDVFILRHSSLHAKRFMHSAMGCVIGRYTAHVLCDG